MRLAKITDNLYVNPQQVLEVQRSGTAVHVAYNLICSRDDKPVSDPTLKSWACDGGNRASPR